MRAARHIRVYFPGITDASLVTFFKIVPCLEELNVSRCSKVTDSGVIAVARGLRRLRSLNVAKCDSITDNALRAIQTYCTRSVLDRSSVHQQKVIPLLALYSYDVLVPC